MMVVTMKKKMSRYRNLLTSKGNFINFDMDWEMVEFLAKMSFRSHFLKHQNCCLIFLVGYLPSLDRSQGIENLK